MAAPAPSMVLFGPDGRGMLYTVDAQGGRRGLFASNVGSSKPQIQMFRVVQGGRRGLFACNVGSSKPQIQMFRIVQGGLHQPFGTVSMSSLSGTITFALDGQPQIKMKDSWEGMQYNKYFKGPAGTMKWRPTKWADGMELWDQAGLMLARYKYHKLSGGDPRLEIFVPLNPLLLDLVVTAAVSIYVDEKKGLKIVGEVISAVAGA